MAEARHLVVCEDFSIFNPRCMHKGYSCVCVFVTMLAATDLVCMSKIRYLRALSDI